METVSEIIGNIREIAPAGQRRLDDTTLRQLRDLTRSLMAAMKVLVGNTRASSPSPSASCACPRRSLLIGCAMPPCW